MPSTFNYSKPVSNKEFLGRKEDCRLLATFLNQGENVTIYEPPKTGVMSIINQTFTNMKNSGVQFTTVEYSILSTRSVSQFCIRLGSAIIGKIASTPGEYSNAVANLLGESHFVFDEKQYEATGDILSLSWSLDDQDIKAILELPYKAAAWRGRRLIVLLQEFQNIMQTEDGEKVCNLLQGIFKSLSLEQRSQAQYLFTGSSHNAMHEIFGVKKYFYRQVERLEVSQIETREIIEYITRGFLTTGKVIDKDLLLGTCTLFRNNIWYINHFASICDSLTRGYIMEPILNEALDILISIHEPRFEKIMNDLTTFQVSLLKAILCGHNKFTSTEVIEEYKLNSSANVKRLKDALSKKEIIYFKDDNHPIVLDPLFEYWASNFYFGLKI